MRAWCVAVVAVVLLPGCMGRGGDGGDVVFGESASPDVFTAGGGRGTNATAFLDGADGCDVFIGDGRIDFCGVLLEPAGSGFNILGAGPGHAPEWEDLRLAVAEPGVALRADGRQVPIDRPVGASDRWHDGGAAPPRYEAGFQEMWTGSPEPGQSFDVCGTAGPGTATAQLRDMRPVGAVIGIFLHAPGCDGTPWTPPPAPTPPAVADYVLRFTGPEAAGSALGSGLNCVEFPAGEPFTVEAEAEWEAQSALAEELEFSWHPTSGEGESVVSTSPLDHPFAIGGSGGVLVVGSPDGAAFNQEVALRLRVVPPSSAALPVGAAAC